ncbi:uncharacterized protein BDR25DRAFT_356934 [Lindgomyces ingoldianus]|uniref:Uncharacterized protein n=1 Tax=Lindgomyces ingoldianus TaxID=673940 RepID=A0ACB6QQG2_9PLEO|nr:uncharacterized protein BDR25DRAFT_356934 [Lindgomyces ingoldianus]KAF2469156.1 hypothetical protein BDR25DRAFT_356934 [Lindgomyces ingoldianus]
MLPRVLRTAPVSFLHAFYYDIFLRGMFFKEIEKIHQRYSKPFLSNTYTSLHNPNILHKPARNPCQRPSLLRWDIRRKRPQSKNRNKNPKMTLANGQPLPKGKKSPDAPFRFADTEYPPLTTKVANYQKREDFPYLTESYTISFEYRIPDELLVADYYVALLKAYVHVEDRNFRMHNCTTPAGALRLLLFGFCPDSRPSSTTDRAITVTHKELADLPKEVKGEADIAEAPSSPSSLEKSVPIIYRWKHLPALKLMSEDKTDSEQVERASVTRRLRPRCNRTLKRDCNEHAQNGVAMDYRLGIQNGSATENGVNCFLSSAELPEPPQDFVIILSKNSGIIFYRSGVKIPGQNELEWLNIYVMQQDPTEHSTPCEHMSLAVWSINDMASLEILLTHEDVVSA